MRGKNGFCRREGPLTGAMLYDKAEGEEPSASVQDLALDRVTESSSVVTKHVDEQICWWKCVTVLFSLFLCSQ